MGCYAHYGHNIFSIFGAFMNNQNVVLTKIGSTVSDISAFVTDVDHAGKAITFGTGDSLYIGSVFPFNALYLRLLSTAVNNNTSVLTASFWDATAFTNFYSVVDGTILATATLGKSGIVNIIAKDDKLPARYDSRNITELGNIDGYYSLYWTKLTFSAALDAVTLLYVGQLFVEADTTIFKEYPDLAATPYLRVYGATKTEYLDQRIIATDRVISDLITMGQVITGEQFLDWRLMKEPTIHKTAELIYKAQGIKYREDMLAANKSYLHSLESRKYGITKTGNILKGQEVYERAPMGFYR
jgi:hypothetical protein